jgi:hypothetical protein
MARNDLDKVLEHINRDRRGFFKTLLIGTAIAAPLMTRGSIAKRWSRRTGRSVKGKIESRGVGLVYPVATLKKSVLSTNPFLPQGGRGTLRRAAIEDRVEVVGV